MQIQMRNVMGEPRERQSKQESRMATVSRSIGQNHTEKEEGELSVIEPGPRQWAIATGWDPIAVNFFEDLLTQILKP